MQFYLIVNDNTTQYNKVGQKWAKNVCYAHYNKVKLKSF